MSFIQEFRVTPKSKRSKEELIKAEDMRLQARDEDSRVVTGIFKNLETKGGDITFTYRKYKEDPYQTFHFEDGKSYSIPIGVAKHLKEMTKVKRNEYLVDKDGKKIVGVGSYNQRFEFIPELK